MNIVLWGLQIVAAIVYAALGIIELICVVGLIVPVAFRWKPRLTVVAASVLALESLVFIWVHVQYGEIPPTIMSGVLGLLMAFIAYGRSVLRPAV
jgi:putative oxidoreductase